MLILCGTKSDQCNSDWVWNWLDSYANRGWWAKNNAFQQFWPNAPQKINLARKEWSDHRWAACESRANSISFQSITVLLAYDGVSNPIGVNSYETNTLVIGQSLLTVNSSSPNYAEWFTFSSVLHKLKDRSNHAAMDLICRQIIPFEIKNNFVTETGGLRWHANLR